MSPPSRESSKGNILAHIKPVMDTIQGRSGIGKIELFPAKPSLEALLFLAKIFSPGKQAVTNCIRTRGGEFLLNFKSPIGSAQPGAEPRRGSPACTDLPPSATERDADAHPGRDRKDHAGKSARRPRSCDTAPITRMRLPQSEHTITSTRNTRASSLNHENFHRLPFVPSLVSLARGIRKTIPWGRVDKRRNRPVPGTLQQIDQYRFGRAVPIGVRGNDD